MPYFGVIKVIWKLNYFKFTMCVFKCKWVDSNIDVRNDDFRFTLVDVKKLAYQNELFIMAEQAKHVFDVQDPCYERWSVVLQGKTIGLNLEDDNSTLDTCDTPFSINMPSVNGEEVDDVHANRNNNDEGELINTYSIIIFYIYLFPYLQLHNLQYFSIDFN